MTKYNLGDKVWVVGKIGEVIGTAKGGILFVEFDPKDQCAYAYYENQVTKPAALKFAIGDLVESRYTFKGRVVGFEEETNRITCVSVSAEEDDRRRYAYLPEEIRHSTIKPAKPRKLAPTQVTGTDEKQRFFKPGNIYDVTTREGDRYQMVRRRSTQTLGKVKLSSLAVYDGTPLAVWVLPEWTTLDELFREGIMTFRNLTSEKFKPTEPDTPTYTAGQENLKVMGKLTEQVKSLAITDPENQWVELLLGQLYVLEDTSGARREVVISGYRNTIKGLVRVMDRKNPAREITKLPIQCSPTALLAAGVASLTRIYK